jgi:RNA polymerase sigma factor (sigma-70 family)
MAVDPMGAALRQIQHLFVEGRLASLPDSELLERFLCGGDQAAFAALVERHGPMVLGTCRAVLRDTNAAEDAFQATFLVLVCKARSIRGQGALAGWLYQVARRVALQAGVEAARRRKRERLVGQINTTCGHRVEPDDDWREILQEELARLSDRYRLPLLLCDLEGKTHAQAAVELECGEATVRRRLAGARDILRSRLIRRGVTLTAGTLATTLDCSAMATVPAGWTEATVAAATRMSSTAARIAVSEVVSTTAAALARRSLHAMVWGQLRAAAAAVVFLVGLVGIAWGVGTYAQDRASAPQAGQTQESRSAPEALPAPAKSGKTADPTEAVTYRGRVVDAEGRPVAGAALYVNPHEYQHPYQSPVRARSGPDGRFRFAVPKADFDTMYWDAPWKGMRAPILAQGDGYAFGLANYRDDAEELKLMLPRDDVPISGRIIDLQGRPVVGATVAVLEVWSPAGGLLDGWLAALNQRQAVYPLDSKLPVGFWTETDPPFFPPAETGADGRFLIAGIGRERVATLEIQGPTIETFHVVVHTRPGAMVRIPMHPDDPDGEWIAAYGAAFEHVAGPTRPIEGIVRDLDTGTPLAGIMVHGRHSLGRPWRYVRAVTDARGHYRLVGLARGREETLEVVAPVDFPLRGYGDASDAPRGLRDEDLPYLPASVKIGALAGMGPIELDIRLKKGIWVTGRVLEADAGHPVRARLEYYVLADNPHQEGYPAFRETLLHYHYAGRDGAFRFVAFPGPGVLTAFARWDQYIQGSGVDALKHEPNARGQILAYPNGVVPMQYQAVAEIDPAPGTVSTSRDLLLRRGRTLTVNVLDLDGKPVSGNEVEVLGPGLGYWEKNPVPSNYTIPNWRPGEERTLRFHNLKRRLTGEIIVRGVDPQPRSIRLRPWGVLTGRIVDADGQPWGVEGELDLHPLGQYTEVGKDGRFRAEGLLPGKTYPVRLREKGSNFREFGLADVTVGPGQTKDLGDIVPRPPNNR